MVCSDIDVDLQLRVGDVWLPLPAIRLNQSPVEEYLEAPLMVWNNHTDYQRQDLSCLTGKAVLHIGNISSEDRYRRLMEAHGLTQEQVASAVGKSRPAVANSLRLLSLPEDILLLVNNGEITAGHGRALLAIKDDDTLYRAVEYAKKGASVREIERMAAAKPQKRPKNTKTSFYKEVELALKEELGRKVEIVGSKGKGTLTIDFYSDEELADMAMRLGGKK